MSKLHEGLRALRKQIAAFEPELEKTRGAVEKAIGELAQLKSEVQAEEARLKHPFENSVPPNRWSSISKWRRTNVRWSRWSGRGPRLGSISKPGSFGSVQPKKKRRRYKPRTIRCAASKIRFWRPSTACGSAAAISSWRDSARAT